MSGDSFENKFNEIMKNIEGIKKINEKFLQEQEIKNRDKLRDNLMKLRELNKKSKISEEEAIEKNEIKNQIVEIANDNEIYEDELKHEELSNERIEELSNIVDKNEVEESEIKKIEENLNSEELDEELNKLEEEIDKKEKKGFLKSIFNKNKSPETNEETQINDEGIENISEEKSEIIIEDSEQSNENLKESNNEPIIIDDETEENENEKLDDNKKGLFNKFFKKEEQVENSENIDETKDSSNEEIIENSDLDDIEETEVKEVDTNVKNKKGFFSKLFSKKEKIEDKNLKEEEISTFEWEKFSENDIKNQIENLIEEEQELKDEFNKKSKEQEEEFIKKYNDGIVKDLTNKIINDEKENNTEKEELKNKELKINRKGFFDKFKKDNNKELLPIITQKEKEIKQLNEIIEKNDKVVNELNEQSENLFNQIELLKEKHKKEINEISSKSIEEIEELKNIHRKEMVDFKKDLEELFENQKRIEHNKLTERFNKEINQIKYQIKEYKELFDNEVNVLRMQNTELKQKILDSNLIVVKSRYVDDKFQIKEKLNEYFQKNFRNADEYIKSKELKILSHPKLNKKDEKFEDKFDEYINYLQSDKDMFDEFKLLNLIIEKYGKDSIEYLRPFLEKHNIYVPPLLKTGLFSSNKKEIKKEIQDYINFLVKKYNGKISQEIIKVFEKLYKQDKKLLKESKEYLDLNIL